MRAVERILIHTKGASSGVQSSGINLATVITDIPVTILIKGDTIALPLDYFVVPEGLKFNKNETLLAYPLLGVDSTNKRFALKPLEDTVMIGLYTGSSYEITGTNISLSTSDVYCPFPLTANISKVFILPNRFPKQGEIWAVINTWQ